MLQHGHDDCRENHLLASSSQKTCEQIVTQANPLDMTCQHLLQRRRVDPSSPMSAARDSPTAHPLPRRRRHSHNKTFITRMGQFPESSEHDVPQETFVTGILPKKRQGKVG